MSGRLVDSNNVKPGETMPVEYLALVDSNKPRETAAAIQAVYLDRRNQAGEVAQFHDTTMGEPERKSDEDILNEVDKRILKTVFNISEKAIKSGEEGSPEQLKSELVEYSVKNPTGMTKEYSEYLYKLEKRLGEKSKERLEISDVPRRMTARERGMKAKQMAIGEHKYPAEPAEKLRKEILATSLFPSIHTHKKLVRGM